MTFALSLTAKLLTRSETHVVMAGTSLVEVINESLRSSLTLGTYRNLLALGEQLAQLVPAPSPPVDAGNGGATQSHRALGTAAVRVMDQVDEEAFCRWVLFGCRTLVCDLRRSSTSSTVVLNPDLGPFAEMVQIIDLACVLQDCTCSVSCPQFLL